mgnify:CR=1 FL=1
MEKTKVIKINAKNQERIRVNGLDSIEEVEEFTYLGSKVCRDERFKEQTLQSKRFICQTKTDLEL